VFLHAIEPGPASRSYGIQVARLAGIPAPVLNQARHTLEALEQQASTAQAQVDLFAPAPAPAATAHSPLEAYVASLKPDTMSPREAMDAIYQLTSLMGGRT